MGQFQFAGNSVIASLRLASVRMACDSPGMSSSSRVVRRYGSTPWLVTALQLFVGRMPYMIVADFEGSLSGLKGASAEVLDSGAYLEPEVARADSWRPTLRPTTPRTKTRPREPRAREECAHPFLWLGQGWGSRLFCSLSIDWTGCMHAPHSFADGVRSGFPHDSQGLPYIEIL